MIKKVFIMLVQVLCLCQVAWAEKTIVFGVNANWPPMEFVDDDDAIVGYSIEFMKAAGRLAGFTPVFKNAAWEELAPGLESGQFDAVCSSTTITDVRKEEVAFSIPYYRSYQTQVIQKGKHLSMQGGLEGMRFGAQSGTTSALLIQDIEGVVLKTYDNIESAMKDLSAGRVEAVIADDPVARYYARVKYSNSLQTSKFYKDVGDEFYGIAVKKGNQEILDLINKGIAAVKAREIDKELKMKWVGP